MNSKRETPSVGRLAQPLVDALIHEARELRIAVSTGPLGCRLIDAGASAMGSIEVGRRLTEICMGGLGRVSIVASPTTPRWPFAIQVGALDPVVACLGSQYAGWSLAGGEEDGGWFALGSGPARATYAKESLYQDIAYSDDAETGVLVLETGAPPPESIVRMVSEATGCRPGALTFIYAPTQSLAGATQVVGRVLEVAMHKVHALHFPMDRILDGLGVAPLSPPSPDFMTAMGRTNDAIIYGGRVHLYVSGPADDARDLAERLPSRSSRDFGSPFAEVFARFNGDFYAIDSMLFSPAEVVVTAVESGKSFRAGAIDTSLVDASFDG
ncbi:methenyltetrahydromethanopterin cyclohydrolase [Methylobrevis pamukkalensis]|uniref:Methenyltetrahydromethanopterin cyclohydrolase n=1 Tax=Methylobrevis pamukkalensis TaxID=1439726 RepID=A0A1E3H779_9HYPH|nr:methenyltetrahydromethanopterin cyclohydrolase [Methylobrevis pamukkalensis]ODN71361.1 Methenyltetrahydromethanopterin cyclohydrolase [Methylobrevis pamukkalensis]